MKRFTLGCIFATSLLLVGGSSAGAKGGPQPLDFHLLSNVQIDQPVEQQTEWRFDGCGSGCNFAPQPEWVTNPTGCAWDVDDHWQKGSIDVYLDSGASVSATECVVADTDPIFGTHFGMAGWWSNPPRYVSLEILSPSPAVTGSVCFQPQARCFSLVPRYDAAARNWRSVGCAALSYDPADPALTSIQGSNGGVGVQTVATVTVTNTSSKRVAKLAASLIVLGGYVPSSDCNGQPYVESYPFQWAS